MIRIYEPEEDSYLLQEQVERFARGRVLDMGTGSGIQAIAAAHCAAVREVVAVDINPDAVFYLKKKKIAKIRCNRSDLFRSVKGFFDVIIFNPPYLPDDAHDPDKALDGGKVGFEIIERFLKDAKTRLGKDGFILTVFSNRTGESTLNMMRREGYESELLSKKSLPFFEELYVYKLTLSPCAGPELYASGKRGAIYLVKEKGKSICIKEQKPGIAVDTIENEARFLKLLNKKGIGPKFISFDRKKGQLRREFVDGRGIEEFLNDEKITKQQAAGVICDVLKQCREMDLLGINKTELTNPYKDIIIAGKGESFNSVMIDFERCRMTAKPKNVTQFLQYLSRMRRVLAEKRISIDEKLLVDLGRAYKDILDEKSFRKIINMFS
ncbi:methyltransferase [Candidatus Woesearchaeota archaeon]|nr:methyltransferase [Candidatus Woesearchaeota archaeon]